MTPINAQLASETSKLALQNTTEGTTSEPVLSSTLLKNTNLASLERQVTSSENTVLPQSSDPFSISNLKFVSTLDPNILKAFEGSAATPTPTSTSTGGTDGSDLAAFNSQIGSLGSQLTAAQNDLQNLDPNDPQYLQKSTADALKIQQLQEQIQQMVTLESNTLKFMNDLTMTIEGNMKS